MRQTIEIRGEMIRLGQLLKLAGAVADGAAAKEVIAAGAVSVNGAIETRRGRQLHDGDLVALADMQLRVSGR